MPARTALQIAKPVSQNSHSIVSSSTNNNANSKIAAGPLSGNEASQKGNSSLHPSSTNVPATGFARNGHEDLSQRAADELGLQRPEIGVDLVAKVNDGSYWAIQCKYHQNPDDNVSYEEISTFLSITNRPDTFPKLSHRLLCDLPPVSVPVGS